MIQQVHSVGFTVSDMEQALAFYTGVLPFQLENDVEVYGEPYERLTGVFGARMRVVTLALGTEKIQLTQYIAPPGGRPIPADSRSNDLWFQHIAIVVSDMDAAYAILRENNVQHVSTAPQTLPDYIEAAAGVKAFYFRDPDGHNLELIWFPEGKGNPRWQNGNALFMGIDHTAIAVTDTDYSLRAYAHEDGFLNLAVAGESLNYGTEQEHLNGVFGCRVRITGLTPPEGIGVEFLDYLAPPGGHYPEEDAMANDLWYWEITMVTNDIESMFSELIAPLDQLVSSGIVTLPDQNPLGYQRAFIFRDRDGHAIKVISV